MARDRSPQCKQCRREGQKLFLKGERCLTDKCGIERRSYPPGDHGRGRQKQSEYRVQLREKQKARRYYGVLEKQFRGYYATASRQDGITGENLLRMLECRLDNVLVRLGFAASRRQARQLVRHGHWTVNGRRVDIPSYQVRDGDVIAVKAGTPAEATIRDATELTAQVPAWLQADHDAGARAAHRRAVLEVIQLPPPACPSGLAVGRPSGANDITTRLGPRCSISKSPGSPRRPSTRTAARS
jgi:small subunit ribosomal protein S4